MYSRQQSHLEADCNVPLDGACRRAVLFHPCLLTHVQGRADLAMAILLRLGRPDILPFIVEHGLFQVGTADDGHFAG